jgi:enoyl-CoA hydratase/carnithine racemase
LVAEYGLSWLLPKLIGLSHALDLLLTGRTISAEDGARMGLINDVVPAEALMDRTLAYARELAQNCSPRSLDAIKAQVYGDFERDRADALARTVELMRESITWPDLAEALHARAEQRLPRFGSASSST